MCCQHVSPWPLQLTFLMNRAYVTTVVWNGFEPIFQIIAFKKTGLSNNHIDRHRMTMADMLLLYRVGFPYKI